MSARAAAWALTQRVGHPTTKLVLLVLADVADNEGKSCYGQKKLAEMTEITQRTLRRHLEELEKAGLLNRVRRHRDNGSRTSDEYALNLPDKSSGRSGDHRTPASGSGGDNRTRASAPPPDTGVPPSSSVKTTSPLELLSESDVDGDLPAGWNEDAWAVFEYWRTRRAEAIDKNGGPPMKPTDGRRSKIQARLAEGYTVELLKDAVDGCLGSEFHVNGGHTDVSLICRNQEKVEAFRIRKEKRGENEKKHWAEELDGW